MEGLSPKKRDKSPSQQHSHKERLEKERREKIRIIISIMYQWVNDMLITFLWEMLNTFHFFLLAQYFFWSMHNKYLDKLLLWLFVFFKNCSIFFFDIKNYLFVYLFYLEEGGGVAFTAFQGSKLDPAVARGADISLRTSVFFFPGLNWGQAFFFFGPSELCLYKELLS